MVIPCTPDGCTICILFTQPLDFQAKQLLTPMPCLVDGEQSSTSLLSVLGGIQALQPAVVDMALDFMVAHCKVHRHQCSAVGQRADEGTTSPITPVASSPQRTARGVHCCVVLHCCTAVHCMIVLHSIVPCMSFAA